MNQPMHDLSIPRALLAALLLLATPLYSQAGGDPRQEIQEIADSIDAQLKEIDRLLLESGKQGQQRTRPKELLEQASEGTQIVEDSLEKLIEKLTEMKDQQSSSSSSSSSDDSQDGQQQQQSQPQPGQQPTGGQTTRNENQTPDMVDQRPSPGQQPTPGQEPQPSPRDTGKPEAGHEQPTAGENRPGNKPPESATGEASRADGSGSWGDLQPYMQFLRARGTTPRVPEKFRKYYEAYRKGKAEKRGR